MASPAGLATSEYLNSDDRVLKKQQLKCLIEELGKVETKQMIVLWKYQRDTISNTFLKGSYSGITVVRMLF